MIVHLLYENEYTFAYYEMIRDYFDLNEHLFIINNYNKHSWDKNRTFHFTNCLKVKSFLNDEVLNHLKNAEVIVLHSLFARTALFLLFDNLYLLKKTIWMLWGHDLYVYREAGTKSNPFEIEEKRKIVIKNFAYISARKEDFELVQKIYNTNAVNVLVGYGLVSDYDDLDNCNSFSTGNTTNILLGNSSTKTNQHIDAINMLSKYKNENLAIYTPLSYGDEIYGKEVADYGISIFGKKFIPIFDFIPTKKYNILMKSIDIGIMNHNRQQAGGNIFSLLYLNKKVFINKSNTIYSHALRIGMTVYDIQLIKTLSYKDFKKQDLIDYEYSRNYIRKYFSDEARATKWKEIFELVKKGNHELSLERLKEKHPNWDDFRTIYIKHVSVQAPILKEQPKSSPAPPDDFSHNELSALKEQPKSSPAPPRILYIAYVEPKYKQLYNKIAGQVQALREIGAKVDAFIIGKGESLVGNDFPFTIINLNEIKAARHFIVEQLIIKFKPDYVYFRYPNGYNNALEPLIPLAEKYKNFYFEHNTKEEDELRANEQIALLQQEINFGRILITKASGLIGMTNSFSEHQKKRVTNLQTPITTIANGITISNYIVSTQPILSDRLVLLFVGYISIHHGIERLLHSIANYKGNIKISLLIVGKFFNSEYENTIRELEKTLNLMEQVHFLGELSKNELNKYYDESHICIGSLGMHLINSPEGASLKTREYISRGKPIIIDHKDTDIPDNVDFVYRVSADSSPIDIDELIKFYKNIKSSPLDIRRFAEEHLDWKIKMKKLIDFMTNKNNYINVTEENKKEIYFLLFKNDFEYNYNILKSIIENNYNYENLIIVDFQTAGQNRKLLNLVEKNIKIIEVSKDFSDEEAVEFVKKKLNCDIKIIDANNTILLNNQSIEQNKNIFRNKEEFIKYFDNIKDERNEFEKNLATQNINNSEFYVNGHCVNCNKQSSFMIDWKLVYNGIPGYRERLICQSCGLSARKRAIIDVMNSFNTINTNCQIYILEQKSKFYSALKSKYGNRLVGSEYLGDEYPNGKIFNGLRNENILNLSFNDQTFDLLISNDVFEHVPNIELALKESFRVLRNNGILLFSIPFNINRNQTTKRAELIDGKIINIENPVYHYDILRKEGSLVFYDYGWDLLDKIKVTGFKDLYIIDSYDISKAQFGFGVCLSFVAVK